MPVTVALKRKEVKEVRLCQLSGIRRRTHHDQLHVACDPVACVLESHNCHKTYTTRGDRLPFWESLLLTRKRGLQANFQFSASRLAQEGVHERGVRRVRQMRKPKGCEGEVTRLRQVQARRWSEEILVRRVLQTKLLLEGKNLLGRRKTGSQGMQGAQALIIKTTCQLQAHEE